MFETESELRELQSLIDRSFNSMGPHMASIVKPERRLNAGQLAGYLQNVKHVSLATVDSKGQPINAPIDGWFLHGQFVLSTGGDSVRARHMRARPAVSLAHVIGDDLGIWAHGTARFLTREDTLAAEYDRAATAYYKSSPYSWGPDIVVVQVQARRLFGYASDPKKF